VAGEPTVADVECCSSVSDRDACESKTGRTNCFDQVR